METYSYQYFVGGIVFLGGLYFAGRQGFVGLSGTGFRNLIFLILGFAGYMGLQGYMQYGTMTVRPPVEYQGSGLKSGVHGTPLDYGIMIGYFLIILAIGTWFGRMQKTTKDFFFGGQKFAWWLVAFSLVATTIGSYSFVKYSKVAYQYGLSSSQTYLNDWFWLPWFIFGWLPIVYFSRVVSIPEYFERRFNRTVRGWATILILVYLIGYVGVNLFTMGKALQMLLGWPIFWSAVLVASISAVYVTAGGQTSVIMTDLFQGVMLLATGLLILYLGADYLGGFDALWENLPRDHRKAFANFNTDTGFNGVGIFWQDAMANSAMFYFLNQGVMMRFMAARSVEEGRKTAVTVLLVLMPVAACVVASGGWVGKALENAGVLPANMDPASVFFVASEFLCTTPGLFGLIMAALTAALMSTVDTLITAVAAIIVNDVYTPLINPEANDRDLLKVARITSVGVTLMGIALVPVFMMFDSIYAAHGAFTAAVTPPLVVTLVFSVFCKRFTAKAATWTLAG
ncbi:MAG: sodium:solute symporter family protein, partial [Deltaproteobacteria bacterium]|nr:sodium:solute symporter family protein [Deltaproteobacteria bacterium]